MAGFARFFVSERYQKTLVAFIWLVLFALALAIVTWISVLNIRESLRAETNRSLAEFTRLRGNVLSTFEVMDGWLTAIPCTPDYLEQLRRVAYIPDGINEFLHAPQGTVLCSVNKGVLDTPYVMGPPDIASDNPFGVSFWFDADLGFLDLHGLTGTLAQRGPHVMVIPPQPLPAGMPPSMAQEVVITAPDGRWWHRSGEAGLFEMARSASAASPLPHNGSYYHTACDPVGVHCVTARVDMGSFITSGALSATVIVLATAIFAAMSTQIVYLQVRRYWAFEERFKRRLGEGVICAYQPLISMKTGEIIGCEVLARWRDLDGSIVYPDAFLPLVEAENLTRELTHSVVARAFSELPGKVKRPGFQVNFNIFPRDFEVATLEAVFPPAVRRLGDYAIVVELVETESLPIDTVQTAIAHLRTLGIRTYIDDFGVGYSNMQNLAMLDIDGVKIDRSFAMAPDNSLMARILAYAIDMAHASGRAILVEGVETRERLEMLRANPLVDYAQGYYISRPLEIDAFARFVESWVPFGGAPAAPAKGKSRVRAR